MNHYNYITGEPLSSPTHSGVYADPNERYQQMAQSQQVAGRVYTFGGAGYNGGQGMAGAPYMNPPGINPLFYQKPQYRDRTEHINGFNPRGSTMMLPANIEEIATQLQAEMEIENETAIARRKARFQGTFNYAGGYYGWNQNQPDQAVIDKYRAKAREIRKEAEEKQSAFNRRMSRIAHNYMGEEISDEELHQIYDGYDQIITTAECQANDKQTWLERLKPFSNQALYAKHFEQMRNLYSKISGNTMQSFLEGQGMLQVIENLEEESHKRRNLGMYYDKDSYHRLLKTMIMKREGVEVPEFKEGQPLSPINLPQYRALSQSSSMLDDGTLSISAPNWVGQNHASIQLNNEMKAHFDENRRKFIESIYAQDQEELPFK